MKITEHEMHGMLTGKCISGDMRVNEGLAAYLVRKFSEQQQKLDAAEAKLAELEKQEPAGKWIVRHSPTEDGYDRFSFASWRGKEPKNNTELFTRPAPAISLVDLVPDDISGKSLSFIADKFQTSASNAQFILVGWNGCRAAILRNIEEKSK